MNDEEDDAEEGNDAEEEDDAEAAAEGDEHDSQTTPTVGTSAAK